MRTVIPFNQGDSAWRDVKLGNTSLTIASHGCYFSVMACGMFNFFKKEVNPKSLVEYANNNGGVDGDGQLVWSVITKMFPNVAFVDSAWTKNVPNANLSKMEVPAALDKIKYANRRGQVVGICVDLIKNDGVTPDHIVLALDTPDDLSQWTIMDPDGGRLIKFSDRYGDPMKGIMGYRILGGTSADYPPDANKSDIAAGLAIGLAIDPRYSKRDILMSLV